MASEIRVDKINSLSGVGTVTLSPTGVDISGITTAATLKATTGIVTTLTATTGIVTTFEATTGNITTLRAPTGIVTSLEATTGNITTLRAPTGIVTSFEATTGDITTLRAPTGIVTSLEATTGDITTLRAPTGIVTTFVTNTANVGAAVTISESGIEASGIGITVANINGTQIGGRRNIIINGDQRIAQRGTAAVTVTTSAGFRCVDRMKTDIDGSGGGDYSHEQSTDVPTGQGFTHSSKITVVTQASQPSGTSNAHQFYIQLEKQDVAHLEWGTSAAKTCTMSFWVKSSITGTYPFYFRHYGGTTHSYYTNYTINSANTWEKKIITITGYTSGGNVSGTTASGLLIEWSLGYASGHETGTLNQWTTASDQITAAGSVYLPENAGATWYVTGMQLEVGSQATPFEFRSFAEELRLCERYYFDVVQTTGTNESFGYQGNVWQENNGSIIHIRFPVRMRATPTFGSTNGTQYWRYFSGNDLGTLYLDGSGLVNNTTKHYGGELYAYLSSGTGAIGRGMWIRGNDTSAKAYYSAEL